MTAAVRPDDDQAWREWRLAGITASDIAMAVSGRYGGAYAVVANKLGLTPPVEQNDRMARGHAWEQRLADAVHVLTGLYVHGEQTWCQNAGEPLHRATIDGMLSPLPEATIDDIEAVLEIKTTGVGVRPPWDSWTAQTQWQMWVTGIPKALVAWAIIDDTDDTLVDLRLRWIDRDDYHIDALIELAAMLWGHITDGTLPDPTSPSALDVVKEVHAIADPEALPVDLSDMVDDLQRFATIKAAAKAVEDERDELEARIRERLGRATKGTAPGVVVSLSKPRAVFTPEAEQAFLDVHPDAPTKRALDRIAAKKLDKHLYDQLAQPIGARALTIKETSK